MERPRRSKLSAEDYIQWLIASPKIATCTEAARTDSRLIAHDAYTRLLGQLEPDPEELWKEVEPLVNKKAGFLVIDDSTLDKPYGPNIELVTYHWSGKHKAVVQGINLVTLLWTDGDIAVPIDWRVYNKKEDGLTKNDHMCQMLETAQQREFEPKCVFTDSWYSSLKNLKFLRSLGWPFFVGLKSNRHVNPDGFGNRSISELEWDSFNQRVHLKGFGWVQAYRDGTDGNYSYFVGTEDALWEGEVKQRHEIAFQIENYHRGIKQECNIERCQARKSIKQRNHIALAIRAFVRLEIHRYRSGVSRYMMKLEIIRDAIRAYRVAPIYMLCEASA